MTPGSYLRMQREVAGLFVPDIVDTMLALALPRKAAHFREWYADYEADRRRLSPELLMALRVAFHFSPVVYRTLCAEADAATPTPTAERNADHG